MNLLLVCEIVNGVYYEVNDDEQVTVNKTIDIDGLFSEVLSSWDLERFRSRLSQWFDEGLIEVGTVLVFDRKGNSTVLPEGMTEIEVYEEGEEYVVVQNISREVGFGEDNEDIDVWEKKTVRIPKTS
jgi:hypothetical protein